MAASSRGIIDDGLLYHVIAKDSTSNRMSVPLNNSSIIQFASVSKETVIDPLRPRRKDRVARIETHGRVTHFASHSTYKWILRSVAALNRENRTREGWLEA